MLVLVQGSENHVTCAALRCIEMTVKINMWVYRCNLEFITNKSQEGSQFCRGFGGIGGILRYSVEMADFEEPGDFDDGDDKAPKDADEWDSDEDFI